MASSPASASASTVSSAVTPTRGRISSSTGRPVQTLVPKSPRNARPSQSRYCVTTGWSSPSLVRSAAICSGVTSAFAPSMICTASPGISRIIRNVSTETPNATVSSSPPRLTAAASTLLPDAHLAQAAQAARRVRLVALDVVADRGEQRAVGEVDDRALASERLLGLVIQPLALGRLTRGAGLGEDLVQLRVAVFEHVGRAAGAERPA